MPEVWCAIPGDPATLTGGYIYARRVMELLPSVGWEPRLLSLPAGFPAPSDADLADTHAAFARVPAGSIVLVDGLAFGVLPAELLQAFPLIWVALVHHPLALETGLSAARVAQLQESERTALGLARGVIATSEHTAHRLTDHYGVDPDSLLVVMPGTDPAHRAQGSGAVPHLLTVATVTPRKGIDVLVKALDGIRDLFWTASIIGSLTRDPETADTIHRMIDALDLGDRITLEGEKSQDELNAAYAKADLFVLPSRYEGYGMVFAEALARGLPIIACAAGAVEDTVPPEAGMLVPVDKPQALADAIRTLLSDAPTRQWLADGAWHAGQELMTWQDTAAGIAEALKAAAGNQ